MKLYKQDNGFSLIEVMVSMIVGAILLAGAIKVYETGYKNNKFNEHTLYMQGVAREVLDALADELRHAGFYGEVGTPSKIDGRLDDPNGAHASPTWLADEERASVYDLSNPITSVSHADIAEDECFNPILVGGACTLYLIPTDSFEIRRLSKTPAGTVASPPDFWTGIPGSAFINIDIWPLVVVNQSKGEVFSATDPIPAGYDPDDPIYTLHSKSFFIVKPSEGTTNMPVNYMRWGDSAGEVNAACSANPGLCSGGWATSYSNSGDGQTHYYTEDFQIQFGVDVDGDKVADMYVNAGAPIAETGRLVTAKMWLLMRSPELDPNADTAVNLSYADKNFVADDGYRYTLFTRNVRLRNMIYEN